MFPPSGPPDHPADIPGSGPGDRRRELLQLVQQLAHELQARGGVVKQWGYAVNGGGTAGAWLTAPDGTNLALTLSIVVE